VRVQIDNTYHYIPFRTYDEAWLFVYFIPYMQSIGDEDFIKIQSALIVPGE